MPQTALTLEHTNAAYASFPFLQMVTDLLLYLVTAKEGHHTEPHGTGEPNEENRANRASRLWHKIGQQQAGPDPQCRQDKCSKPVDGNDNFRKSVIAWFASRVDATDMRERVYTNPVGVAVSSRINV